VVCDLASILPEHLPDSVRASGGAPAAAPAGSPVAAGDTPAREGPAGQAGGDDYRTSYMRRLILDALQKAGGRRDEAALLLKISRKTLYNRMKELGIRHDFS
jgi:DNA-binding NtrC family response regulator